MANTSKITIRVSHARAHTTITYRTNGQYYRLTTAGFSRDLTNQPVITSSSISAFWLVVLAAVQADMTANPTPP